jgi:hypothetical protein
VAEWLKAPVSKTGEPRKGFRGFESHSFLHGQVAERSKAGDCKSPDLRVYEGSNPSLPTNFTVGYIMEKELEVITFTSDENGALGAHLSLCFNSTGELDPILAQMTRFLNMLGFDGIVSLNPERSDA